MPRTLLKRGRLLLKKLISAIFLAGVCRRVVEIEYARVAVLVGLFT